MAPRLAGPVFKLDRGGHPRNPFDSARRWRHGFAPWRCAFSNEWPDGCFATRQSTSLSKRPSMIFATLRPTLGFAQRWAKAGLNDMSCHK